MAGTGGVRPNSGRKLGSKNAETLARDAEINNAVGEFSGKAIDFLRKVYESANVSLSIRTDCAKAVASYESAKLTSVTISEQRAADREGVRTEVAGRSTAELQKLLGIKLAA